MSRVNKIIRKNLIGFKPYSSARNEYTGSEGVFLDANENSLGSASKDVLNRYPDPQQRMLKTAIGKMKKVSPENIFIGNGSDEAIDLLFRAFCEPRIDRTVIMPPTYGMYEVCARLNDIGIDEIPLKADFEIDIERIQSITDERSKLIFVCSPNNPTANVFKREDIITLLNNFHGLVVVDEAYIDFSSEKSWLEEINRYDNLVVLQTFSKAWGMANVRMGMAYAQREIIEVLSAIKYPYNINGITQQVVLEALQNVKKKEEMVRDILRQREIIMAALRALNMVTEVFPSETNFILARFKNARQVYEKLVTQNIIIRDRSGLPNCSGCLRITVGKPQENEILISLLKEMDQ
jgi:histidinol-phosphate aminotransferase